MTTETEHQADPTTERIRALMVRKGWGQNETARQLGIPPGTMGNWMQGTKKPSAVVGRLIEVMGLVEALAPHLYTAILKPEVKKDGEAQGETTP